MGCVGMRTRGAVQQSVTEPVAELLLLLRSKRLPQVRNEAGFAVGVLVHTVAQLVLEVLH